MIHGKNDIRIAAIAFAAGIAVTILFYQLFVGEWKPSGDGRTIVNTSSGELRWTRSGRTVKESDSQAVAFD
ncbi:hypothetical protein Pr1d_24030 [Bythopirellula goksoeyrii]|uniref:Uncharacterized protein n=1 Tax=Bythopirellula goksoeyrii TaxID=1400387 RepID=A0A5B9QC69_9BACT|nr:hypothetical protein Pr1d_24030 [Bythopirellula goksoeyrii]